MPVTYIPLATQTLSSATASVTFSSIPQTYTDLIFVVTSPAGHNTGSGIQLNSDTAYSTNYSRTVLTGNGTSASSFRNNGSSNPTANHDLGALRPNGNLIAQFMNYSNTTTNKTIISRANGAANDVTATVMLWQSTSAVSSFVFTTDGGNLSAGMTFSLYGVASTAASAKATGGNLISSDGTYYYHTFTSSGTFTPTQSLSADILVVAGGGGGGSQVGGGGGAGGLLTFTSQSLSATSYTCTVGGGGAAGTYTNTGVVTNRGSSGSNSQFGSLTACVGGGGGGGYNGWAGLTGGSGGGSDGGVPTGNGAGTAGQGFSGGTGFATSWAGGGGGGAGGAGANATANVGGNGGIGATSSLINAMGAATGTGQLSSGNYYYAGGGGGCNTDNTTGNVGTGGLGGGARGTNNSQTTPPAGTANTGGGGGGSRDSISTFFSLPSAGGSGLVIVRYPV